MQRLGVEQAVSLIKQECEQSPEPRRPFFFVVGAGISSPPLPLANEIVAHCRSEATKYNRTPDPAPDRPIDSYSAWFQLAYPAPVARQAYLRELIQGKPISEANLRLAHILSSRRIATTVVTPNFDDFLSRALTLFGVPHVLCDHPQTTERIDPDASQDIQVVHVHGSYWFYDCCNLVGEVQARAQRASDSNSTMSFLIDSILRAHAPLVMGYSGWESDVIMSAIKRRLQSALPHNLYWFCYNESELQSLPDWLKEHRNVFVVAPETAASEESLDSGLGTPASAESIPAKAVFDAIIRTFALETPALTRDPLEFLAQHLRASLYGGDVSGTADIYGIRSVIDRLERAKAFEGTLGDDASRLELIREAIRRSDYDEAVSVAASLKIEQMEPDHLEQVRELVTTAMTEAGESHLGAPTLPYDILNRVNSSLRDRGAISDDEWERRVAKLLFEKAAQLRYEDDAGSIAAYDEIVTRFRETHDPELQRAVAEALVCKAETLPLLDADAESVADLVLSRYNENRRDFLLQWSRALIIKVEAALHLEWLEETVDYADALLHEIDGVDETGFASIRDRARYARADALGQLDRHSDAIDEVETLLREQQRSTEPADRMLRIKTHYLHARILQSSGDIDAALAAFDTAIVALGGPTDGRKMTVARLLMDKADMATEAGRPAVAAQSAEALVKQFGTSRLSTIRDLVKRAEAMLGAVPTSST